MPERRTRALLLLVAVDDAVRSRLAPTFEIYESRNAARALELFSKLQPDAVLIDAHEVDGIALCLEMRAMAGGRHTPIVIATEEQDEEWLDRAYDAGATDFVTKPLSLPLLVRRVRYLLRTSSELRDAHESAARLARAQCLARLVHWDLVLETGRFRWSEDVTSIFGIPADAGLGSVAAMLKWVHTEDRLRVARALLEPAPHSIEYRLVLPDGSVRVVNQEAEVVVDDKDNPVQMIGAAQDVTELREAERQVHELAYFDSLTRLPNRVLLRRFMERAVTTDRPLAVLAIDLDGFKRVNDTLGHAAGDQLLREVATRITSCVDGALPPTSTDEGEAATEQQLAAKTLVARLGGDEFVVVLTDLATPDDAAKVARSIGESVAASFTIGSADVFVSSSIGIACLPENGNAVDKLLEDADTAMYDAKDKGRNNFQFFNAGLKDKARRAMAIENALRVALVRSKIVPGSSSTSGPCEFHLVFQPKIEIPSGRMVGTEALLRWTSPELGFVSPAEFIPVAEDSGLILQLGEWVLRTACIHAVEWQKRHLAPMRVAVNVSARQFREADFARTVASILAETGAPPELIELEITEGVIMQDTASSSRILDDLKSLGLRIALDDFGTGYSSLSYLTRLPIDALKIDRSFIRDLPSKGKGATITSAIIALSRGLAIDVVVEGVETEAQLDFVASHGHAEIQGYLFAKPMPISDLEVWHRTPRALPRARTESNRVFSISVPPPSRRPAVAATAGGTAG
ncbi:MAG TPA: EAL domain-containing protein [Labilithrix sp.]|nr:EAL domain-containing protein [Labilithrix sp.]